MRLSRNLRRFRWLVFTGWLLALVPAIYLAMTQSGHLTGGGFEVAGSQSLRVHDQLEDQYHDQGASSLALVAAPRADASYQDMNDAVALLRRIAGEFPGVAEAPNPTQRPPQPDRPYVVSLRLDARNAGTSDIAKKLREKVGVNGDQSGQTANGHVRLYVIGQGALSAAAAANTKHDIAEAERWNLPIILIVLLAVFGSLAAAAIPLALGVCTVVGHHGPGLPAVDAHHHVGVRDLDGVDVRHRARRRLLAVHPDALPRGTARRPAANRSRGRRDGDFRAGGGAVRDDRHRLAHRDLPDQHPGAEVDGHRSDSRRRGGDADGGHLDAGGAGDVRPGGRQEVGAAALVAPAGEHPVPVLEPLDRMGDAPAVDLGAGGVDRPARHGGAGVVDGAGQQPAAPVRLFARDPRRGGRGGPGARARRAGPGSGAGHLSRRRRVLARARPDNRRDPSADDAGSQRRLGGTAAIRRRQRQRAAVRGVVGRSRGPGRPGNRRLDADAATQDSRCDGASGRRRPDRADQGFR